MVVVGILAALRNIVSDIILPMVLNHQIRIDSSLPKLYPHTLYRLSQANPQNKSAAQWLAHEPLNISPIFVKFGYHIG